MNQSNDGQSSEQPTPQIDADLEREIAEALGDANVEELMQAVDSANQPAAPSENKSQSDEPIELDIKRGRIVSISGEDVFVDLTGVDGKNQGVVPLAQFERPPRDGSIMDFVVDRFDDSEGLYILSREGAVQSATWDHIHNGSTVEARVTGTNKGGLELEMVGGINAFMPASLVDIHRIDDLDTMIGQKIHAKVQEIDRKNKRVLISRRHFLEAERKAAQDKAWKTLEPGMIVEGTVDNIMEYGAFVDIGGGVDGLVHISDMSYGHINNPSEVVKKGDKVQVKVISLDKEKNRIKLGLKQVQPDPWEGIADRLAPGSQIRAKVVRVADFGAFVEIEPGVEGLLPGSEMSWKRGRVEDTVKVGDEVTLSVLQVDESKRRVSLSLKQVGGDPWLGAEAIYAVHSVVEATVRSVTDFGAFVEVTDGIEGLVHISELSDQRVNTVEDVLKVGDTKKFRILEIDETERKIRLSLKQVDKLSEPSESKGRPRGSGGGRGGRGDKRDDIAAANTVQSRNKRGERVIEFTPKKKDKDGDTKGGMGSAGGMGTGLGGLSLGDLEP